MIRCRWWVAAAAAAVLSGAPSVFAQMTPLPLGPPPFAASWRYPLFVHPILVSEYNRVDGIVQSLDVRGRWPLRFDRPPLVEPFGRVDVQTTVLPHYHVRGGAFGVKSHLSSARLGATHGTWAHIGATYFKTTESPDDWIVGSAENSLAALMTRHDYRNYYRAEGYSIKAGLLHIPKRQTLALALRAAWKADRHDPLRTRAEWSLFPFDRSFRPNITATPGDERMLRVRAAVKVQDAPRVPYRTFRAGLTFEKVGGSLGGDFEHDGAFIDCRGMTRTIGDQSLSLRIIAGSRTGDLPPQYRLRLGGIGSLRGVTHQSLTGNRMWMINAEYRLNRDLLGRVMFWPHSVRRVIALLDIGFLYDVGTAYTVNPGGSMLSGWFEGRAIDDWGVFLSVAHDFIRLEWATTDFLGSEHSSILRMRVGLIP